ncbi:unnamed protein product, partial [Mycena citricolor]
LPHLGFRFGRCPMDRTLLLPTIRQPHLRSPHVLQINHRTRSNLNRPSFPSADNTSIANDWIGLPLHFEVATERIELDGFQIYAVEKWIVDRNRAVTCLTVYTGDPAHRIIVTALRPAASLSPAEAHAEWDKAIQHLRRDARPRETPHGVVLATSLAHFRSDYTIVPIPNGDFLLYRDKLYTNINLLRMGCSGRSALTLEEPSDTTKDRFIATYHLPESIINGTSASAISTSASPAGTPNPSPSKHRTRLSISPPSPRAEDTPPALLSHRRHHTAMAITLPSPFLDVAPGAVSPSLISSPGGRPMVKSKSRGVDRGLFGGSVLELVRLVQIGLAIFGLFSIELEAFDGLLCDKTVEGLNTWTTEIGVKCVNVELTEQIADPAVICALLSLVLATRNKLAVLAGSSNAYLVPKDPFLRPHAFLVALSLHPQVPSHHHFNLNSTPSTPSFPFLTHSHSLPTTPAASTLALSTNARAVIPLSRASLEHVNMSYSDKVRVGERRRSKGARALLRLDGESSDSASGSEGDKDHAGEGSGQLLTGIGSLVGLNVGGGAAAASGVLEPSVDLEAFVRTVVGKGRGSKDRANLKGIPILGGKGRERALTGATELADGTSGVDRERKEKGAGILNGVAGTVRGLWSGLVWEVAALRDKELQVAIRRRELGDRANAGALSDGDDEELRIKADRDGGRSTEDETGGALNDKWGNRVQKKFESWTRCADWKTDEREPIFHRLSRLERKKPSHPHHPNQSVELSSGRNSLEEHSSPSFVRKRPRIPLQEFSPSPDVGEDDILSSGQASPVLGAEDPRTPTQIENYPSAASSAANLVTSEEFGRKLSAFNTKRPPGIRAAQARIASWSDPISAQALDESDSDGSAASRPKKRKYTASGLARAFVLDNDDDEHVLHDEPEDTEAAGYLSDAPARPSRRSIPALSRRRSWHADSQAFRGLEVIHPERMRIDVALCGQFLVMWRREQYLDNVLACVKASSCRSIWVVILMGFPATDHFFDRDQCSLGARSRPPRTCIEPACSGDPGHLRNRCPGSRFEGYQPSPELSHV